MNEKIMAIMIGIFLVMMVMTGNAIANKDNKGHEESAPNSGDGIPDGSGYDSPNGPNGEGSFGSGHHSSAPNSGDGISDGSGWQ